MLQVLYLAGEKESVARVASLLENGAFECRLKQVANADEFRVQLARESYDLILADFEDAPGGRKALDTARQTCPATPFVVLLGDSQENDIVECLRRGAVDCIAKTGLQRLPGAIERALAEARGRRTRQESEECLREFIESAYGFLWMTEPGRDRLLYASPAYERIWGRSLDALIRNPKERVEAVLPDDADRVKQALAGLENGIPYDEEYRIRRPDGSIRWVWDRGRPVPEGAARFLVGVAEDITRRKELETQLTRAQKLESLDRFAGGVAHDLNNQLFVILGAAELALDANHDDAIHEDLELILTAGGKATALTTQLLAFSRRQVLQPVVTDFNETVVAAQPMFTRALGEAIELVLQPAANPSTVKVDPVQLEQVIVNLVLNARDAMPTGGSIVIETHNEYVDGAASQLLGVEPGEYIRLAVRDTGEGMDEDTLAQVFEPFFTTKETGKGTGLGLAVAHGIVRQSGGAIRAESATDHGSTFEVFLPIVREDPTVAPAVHASEPPRGAETILLVEDDELVLDLLRRVLAKRGYRVLAASTPEDAVDIALQSDAKIDLLITDVVMPHMSGQQLAAKVRELRPDIRTMFMSGYTQQAIAPHGAIAPGSIFVEKPMLSSMFAKKVREALRRVPKEKK